jgi:hypothetical protein
MDATDPVAHCPKLPDAKDAVLYFKRMRIGFPTTPLQIRPREDNSNEHGVLAGLILAISISRFSFRRSAIKQCSGRRRHGAPRAPRPRPAVPGQCRLCDLCHPINILGR